MKKLASVVGFNTVWWCFVIVVYFFGSPCMRVYWYSIGEVSLDIAEDRDTGLQRAFEVEHCQCPAGYRGLSCEVWHHRLPLPSPLPLVGYSGIRFVQFFMQFSAFLVKCCPPPHTLLCGHLFLKVFFRVIFFPCSVLYFNLKIFTHILHSVHVLRY